MNAWKRLAIRTKRKLIRGKFLTMSNNVMLHRMRKVVVWHSRLSKIKWD